MTFVPFARYFNPTLIASVVGQLVTFANGAGLNMRFRVARSMDPTPDSCRLEIEGLDPVRAKLMTSVFRELGVGAVMVVQAGYDVTAAGLFSGTLRSVSTTQSGPSFWTNFEADDGGDAFAETRVPLPTTAGLTAAEMISLAASAMGLVQSASVASVVATALPIKQGPYAAAGIRMAADLLDEAARILRCRWWIRDGQIHLASLSQADLSRPAVVLSDAIVTTPLSEGGSGVVELGCFMDPNIVPGSQVFYRGTYFRAEAVLHSGELRSASPLETRIVGRAL